MLEQDNLTYLAALQKAARDLPFSRNQEKGLRGHIANTHFSPLILPWYGVARFDIDLAKLLNIRLEWVVAKGMQYLETGWPEYQQNFDELILCNPNKRVVFDRTQEDWNTDWCKKMVYKNLLYIEQSGTANFDRSGIYRKHPHLEGITLDMSRDSFDPDYDLAA